MIDKRKTSWEKEFDKLFLWKNGTYRHEPQFIKDFIRSLLSQARKEGIEEFADWVWKGWNLDLANKEKAVKHFIELKKK